MRTITGNVYRVRYAVAGAVRPAVLVEASSASDADTAVLLHASAQPGYAGEEIRVLALEEIALQGAA